MYQQNVIFHSIKVIIVFFELVFFKAFIQVSYVDSRDLTKVSAITISYLEQEDIE